MHLTRLLALAGCTALFPLAAAATVDQASLETGSGAKVQMLRVAVQKNWTRKYFHSNGTHVGAYWDLSLAQWRGNSYKNVPGQHQNITDIGLTPVFRFQSDSLKGWYAEGGIGVHLLSERYDNDSNFLSTAFQFGDHLGAGYVFDNKWELGMRLQHFSNANIKKPNSGVDFLLVKLARRF
ncbi:MAG: acyloxyacyl hydrolase [Pseudomonadota bacterium]